MDNSQPPPKANPLTAAITGIAKVSIFLKTSFPFLEKASPSFFDKVLISAMSAPATKDFSPSPVMINAWILSVSIFSRALSNSSRTLLFKAFKALGRFMVKIAMFSSSWYLINSAPSENIKVMHKMKIIDFIF